MPIHKKYPCHNTSLSNLPRETWKGIPDFEDLYQVSSHGRIKSLPRPHQIPAGRGKVMVTYWTREKIRKIKVHRKWNATIGEPYFECTIALFAGGAEINCLVHRLVYQAFVQKIEFDSDQLVVMHKDGDGLNNHHSNLVAGTRHDLLKKSYLRKRHISPFALKTKKEFREIGRRSALTRQKKIIQYSLQGERLRVFDSIKSASRQTGIAGPNLIRALKGQGLTSGNFVWRYHPGRKKISTKYIQKSKA